MLAPAIWSPLAIGFAESISDFGVAATLACNSNFSLATYQLFAAIGNFPPNFPLASAMGMLLVAAIAIPLALQARALRGRSYQMLSGRTRQVIRGQLSPGGAVATVAGVGPFYLVALGIPGFGAVSASLLGDYCGSFSLTLVNYRALLHETGHTGRLERSLIYAAVTSLITVTGGFVAAPGCAAAREVVQGPGFPAAGGHRAAQRGLHGGLHLRLQPADLAEARHQPVPDDHAADHRLRCVQSPH